MCYYFAFSCLHQTNLLIIDRWSSYVHVTSFVIDIECLQINISHTSRVERLKQSNNKNTACRYSWTNKIMPARKKKATTTKKATTNTDSNTGNQKDIKKEKHKFVEPKIKWRKSKAKLLLYQDVKEGRVPLEKDEVNEHGDQLSLEEVYASHPEYAKYDYEKFSSRLSSIRKTVKEHNHRAEMDQSAFSNFVAAHPPSLYSAKGYIQWQGSRAKKQLKDDLRDDLHKSMGKKKLWGYRLVYYENFSLEAFRQKLDQMIHTNKHMYTLKVKGKQHKSS
jgi:hypothetical protein